MNMMILRTGKNHHKQNILSDYLGVFFLRWG